ncbi:unnamed protein product [Urochloa decumbens]|uniref:DUF6598 domain-containing protein n=2 Tax=Urochloa decumbens TaxID=240449 RepID=A0ABC9GRF7_9POAL
MVAVARAFPTPLFEVKSPNRSALVDCLSVETNPASGRTQLEVSRDWADFVKRWAPQEMVEEGAGSPKRGGRFLPGELVQMVEKDSSEQEEEEGPDRFLAAQARRFMSEWNALYSGYYGRFEDTTQIPNMRFTYEKPTDPVSTATLQIFSLKVTKIRGDLQWPLHVFGMVAVRDAADHNRNMIFLRPRESCQILTQEDPYLKLTGPTRAVVLVDPVTFEVDMQVKGITEGEDESLSFLAVTFTNSNLLKSKLIKTDYASKLSTLEFKLGSIVSSVEATIFLKVRPGWGSWPDGFRARFSACTASIAGKDKAEVILLDSGDDKVHIDEGSISLSRCVASVEISGKLKVCVEAWRGEDVVVSTSKSFKPKEDGC